MEHKINHKRTEKMQRHPIGVLKQFAESGSLSAAAAKYELKRREAANKNKQSFSKD